MHAPDVARNCVVCQSPQIAPGESYYCADHVELQPLARGGSKGRNAPACTLTAGSSPVHVPVPVPSIEETERADLDVLLDRQGGHAKVSPVVPRDLPPWATPSMRRVLDDLAVCSGLLLAAGDDGTVIYAVDWAARRLGLSGSTVSVALKRLRHCGAIRLVTTLPAMEGRPTGARVYAVEPRRLRVVEGGAE